MCSTLFLFELSKHLNNFLFSRNWYRFIITHLNPKNIKTKWYNRNNLVSNKLCGLPKILYTKSMKICYLEKIIQWKNVSKLILNQCLQLQILEGFTKLSNCLSTVRIYIIYILVVSNLRSKEYLNLAEANYSKLCGNE